ncbi:AIR synthase related protein [Acidianus sp. HS-5]|uniref:AIR synthase related protein n=1 Tax=Acidianus sp. HS-5 TaxID=2886040 RepID=UPI001F2C3067|nr:AIR synthase related protein [Acidianus sp. HS-5]BDC19246.1 thiamine-monophosphate kinase [Acidianus sp. HS-5]
MKLKDIGEHDFIKRKLSKFLGSNVFYDVYTEDGFTYKIDGFQLSYFFSFMDYYDIGWKAVTATVSDLISSGSKPKLILSSIGISPETEDKQLEDLFYGIISATEYYEAKYTGGDLNNSEKNGWVDVTGIGTQICNAKNNPNNGDIIIISDEIGFTSEVFISYLNNFNIPIHEISKLKVKHPVVNKNILNFYREFCSYIISSTDISDGLLISLQNLSSRLNYSILIDDFNINPDIYENLHKYGYKIDDVLKYSGEEFSSLFVVKREKAQEIVNWLNYYNFSPKIIGKLGKRDRNEIKYKDNTLNVSGWDNFKGWY